MGSKVLINGAGIAGLACRLTLQRAGISSDVLDLAPALAKPEQDTPLILTSNATRVLHQIGLQSVVDSAQRLDHWSISDSSGKKLGGVSFANLAADSAVGGFPTVSLKSNDLLNALIKASKGDAKEGGSGLFRMAAGVSEIIPSPEGLKVSFTSKSMKPRAYSLVVGADGVASKVREICLGPIGTSAHVRFPGWGYWSCQVPRELCSEIVGDHGAAEIWGQGKRFGVFALPDGLACCYGTINHARPKPPVKQASEDARAFASQFEEMATLHDGSVDKILHYVRSSGAKTKIKFQYPAPVELLEMPCNTMPVALIGDAAHAVLPVLFQGPALALEDGYTLAVAVTDTPNRQLWPSETMRTNLEQWTRHRGDRAGLVRNITSEISRAASHHNETVGVWGSIVNSLIGVAVHEKSLEARMKLIFR